MCIFAAAEADILLTAALAAVVVVVGAVVGLAVVAVGAVSSASGLTTTREVTGVTKLYLREMLVAFSASNLCIAGSVVFSLAKRSSLMVKYAHRRCTKLEIPSKLSEHLCKSSLSLPFSGEIKTSFSSFRCCFESVALIDIFKSLMPGLTLPATTNSEP